MGNTQKAAELHEMIRTATAYGKTQSIPLAPTTMSIEDYITGFGLQRSLKAGAIDNVTFGCKETGAQRFHDWVDRIIAADDQELNRLFEG